MLSLPINKTAIVWHRPKDSTYDLTSLLITLTHRNYQITVAGSEIEVVRAIEQKPPDLLFIHLQTAEERGYELCKSLREITSTAAMPILFIGTRKAKGELVRALKYGADDYLKLPLTSKEVTLRLERHLHRVNHLKGLKEDYVGLSQQIRAYHLALLAKATTQAALKSEIQTLQKLAYSDGLTHVANRYAFEQNIAQHWAQAWTQKQPLALLLCDIDYFKSYNDTYGHLEGDRCLRAVAQALMRGASRHRDQVARYGGEEFAILLPETDLQGAQQVALSIQSEIAKLRMPHKESRTSPYVSVSIGLCCRIPQSLHEPYETLIQEADRALYAAKRRGRDRTVVQAAGKLITMVQNLSYGSREPNSCTLNGSLLA